MLIDYAVCAALFFCGVASGTSINPFAVRLEMPDVAHTFVANRERTPQTFLSFVVSKSLLTTSMKVVPTRAACEVFTCNRGLEGSGTTKATTGTSSKSLGAAATLDQRPESSRDLSNLTRAKAQYTVFSSAESLFQRM